MTVRKLKGSAIQTGTITSTQLSGALNSSISAGGGPKISNIIYPGDDTAANTAGGQTVYIVGSGFAANAIVYINGNSAPSVSFISSSNLQITTPALSAASYPVYVINPEDGGTAIKIPGLVISGEPTWSTSATLPEQDVDNAWNISLSATSDSNVAYALADGSSLPSGISLAANGLISGTMSSPPASETTYNFTVVASDAENQDASRAFSVNVTTGEGVAFANTVLLLHADGTNNQNNHTFLDSSNNNFTITRNGNATQGSFSPFSQTGWSGYFDGSGDYLLSPASANVEFNPSNGFTIEGWVHPQSTGTYQFIVSSVQGTGGFESWWFIGITPGGNWRVSYGGASAVDTGTAVTFNVWSHFALSSSGTNTKFFVNGTQIGNVNVNQQNTNMNLTIGNYSGTTQYMFKGHISNLRYVKGIQSYTEAFTPPTASLTNIANTSLLTLQSNRFVDNSNNNFTITRNGDVRIVPYSPFAPTSKYTTANIGGSAYFDGSGDFLTSPNTSFLGLGTEDFTIEFWAYGINFPNTWNTFFDLNQYASGILLRYQGGVDSLYIAGTAYDWSPTTNFPLNVWNHVALTRSSGAVKLFINGSSVLSVTNSSNLGSTSILRIGESQHTSGQTWVGYISDFRILKGTALYTSNFTPSTTPLTNIANTSLLLNFTNAGIFDSTAKNVLETVGDAKVNTSVVKYGTGSMYFDGTGDYLAFPASPNYTFGTGDFTIETWFRKTANKVNSQTLFDHRSSEPSVAPFIGIIGVASTANDNKIEYYANGVQRIISSSAILNNVWYHVAVVRYNSNTTLYIDGASAGNTIFYDTSNYNTSTLRVGGRFAAISGDFRSFNGYIDDLRISRFARYTSNFTPPTAAFKDR